MNEKRPFRGIKTSIRPGEIVHCPVCDETLTAIDRNGYAWVPAHQFKKPVNVMPYQYHTRGTK